MPGRHSRARAALLLAILLVAQLAGFRPALVPSSTAAAQPDPTHVETIRAAFTLLMDQFYRPPEPAMLLGAAWDGAAGELSRAGYPGPLPRRPQFPAGRAAAWSAFAAAYPSLAALTPAETSRTELAFAAADAMAASLQERHTTFLAPEDYREFVAELSGDATRIGLGVLLADRPPWVIIEVAPRGPAERAGMKPGDTILTVGGRDVTRGGRAALDRALAGGGGGPLSVTAERPGEGGLLFTVSRGAYAFPDVETRVLPGGVGYLRLRSFSAFISQPGGGRTAIQDVDAALAGFESAGVSAWVLDLRDNPGGFVFTANELAGRFLPDAVTYVAADERGHRGEQAVSGRPLAVQRPMVVLVNGGSASASEIVASVMQEHGRAVLVGTRTAGALAGSQVYPLPDGAALQVAVAGARTGRGNAVVDEAGVVPDLEVGDSRGAADYAAGRDPQLAAAIAALAGTPPPPPPPAPVPGQLTEPALRALLAGYLPGASEVPATALIPAPRDLGDLVLTYANQYVNALGPVEDAGRLAQTVQERGWQGSVSRFYGQVPALNGPYLGVTLDLYSSQAGAYNALNANDAPQLQHTVATSEQFGDGAAAYLGSWVNAGGASLSFRSGRTVVTVAYTAVPGQESFEPVMALARLLDARLRAGPVPPAEFQPAAAGTPAPAAAAG